MATLNTNTWRPPEEFFYRPFRAEQRLSTTPTGNLDPLAALQGKEAFWKTLAHSTSLKLKTLVIKQGAFSGFDFAAQSRLHHLLNACLDREENVVIKLWQGGTTLVPLMKWSDLIFFKPTAKNISFNQSTLDELMHHEGIAKNEFLLLDNIAQIDPLFQQKISQEKTLCKQILQLKSKGKVTAENLQKIEHFPDLKSIELTGEWSATELSIFLNTAKKLRHLNLSPQISLGKVALKPNSLPDLKKAVFDGSPLSLTSLSTFLNAAPGLEYLACNNTPNLKTGIERQLRLPIDDNYGCRF